MTYIYSVFLMLQKYIYSIKMASKNYIYSVAIPITVKESLPPARPC